MFAGKAGDGNENQLSRGPWSWLVIYRNTNTHLWAKIKSIFGDEAGDGCDSLSASGSRTETEISSRMCKVIVGSSNSFFFWLTTIPTQPSHVIQLTFVSYSLKEHFTLSIPLKWTHPLSRDRKLDVGSWGKSLSGAWDLPKSCHCLHVTRNLRVVCHSLGIKGVWQESLIQRRAPVWHV